MEQYQIYYNAKQDQLVEVDIKHNILYYENTTYDVIMGKVLEESDLKDLELL